LLYILHFADIKDEALTNCSCFSKLSAIAGNEHLKQVQVQRINGAARSKVIKAEGEWVAKRSDMAIERMEPVNSSVWCLDQMLLTTRSNTRWCRSARSPNSASSWLAPAETLP
jgi:hypothetical protein